MNESIYTSAYIVLFGRLVDDLSITSTAQATADHSHADKQFARIYGFSHDGAYYEIPTPVLFLVKGPGEKAEDMPVPGPNPRDKKFVADLCAWKVARTDDTVRLDVEQGKYQDILLDIGIEGAGTGVSGAKVSGAKVSGAKVSGAKVSGARISGARD